MHLVTDYGPKFLNVHLESTFTLGQRATSRVEAMHSLLKRYIKVATLGILDFSAKLNELFNNVATEYRLQREIDLDIGIICSDHITAFLQPVIHEVPKFVILLIVEEHSRQESGRKSLPDSRLSQNYGLPNIVLLQPLWTNGDVLDIVHFHPHWLINRVIVLHEPSVANSVEPLPSDTSPVERVEQIFKSAMNLSKEQEAFLKQSLNHLIETLPSLTSVPEMKKQRGRPLGSRNTSRNPSHFETNEPPVKRPRGRPNKSSL
ncbi:hypothetical protein RCL1_008092 [Eukaryota sp. TZLM3-RCL]